MPFIARDGFIQHLPTNDSGGANDDTDKSFAYTLWKDLVNSGFFTIVAANGAQNDATIDKTTNKIILRPTVALDPFIEDNPWHIYFVLGLNGYIRDVSKPGNDPIIMNNSGLFFGIGPAEALSGSSPSDYAGAINSIPANLAMPPRGYPLVPNRFHYMNNAIAQQAGQPQLTSTPYTDQARLQPGYPMSYRLTLAERGFVIVAYDPRYVSDFRYTSMICVQRGVTCDGTLPTDGKKPLYLVTNTPPYGANIGDGTAGYTNTSTVYPRDGWYYEIVRESDSVTSTPNWGRYTTSYPAGHGIGQEYSLNNIFDPQERGPQTLNYFPTRWNQPVTTDTGEYILLFPFGLNGARNAYSYEIDLIAVSRSLAYYHGQTVPINVYGQAREYLALTSNDQNINATDFGTGAGVRMFMMSNSPEFV